MAQDALARLDEGHSAEYENQQIEWEARDVSLHVLKYMRPNKALRLRLGDKTFSTPERSMLKDLIDRPDSMAALTCNLDAASGQADKLFKRIGQR